MLVLVTIVVSIFLTPMVFGARIRGPAICCTLLELEFKGQGKIIFPQSPDYNDLNTYWTPSAQQQPTCIFSPSDSVDISQAVKLFTRHNCAFAIRGGGHSHNPGWASINNGLLVSLSKLNTVVYDSKSNSVKVGGGSRWKNVYHALEPHNVTAVGGQNGMVGVGGYLLGGGVSFLSNEYGWATDNVKSFELVTADGCILNANDQEHSDLFRSLKGGSSNFGIVTGFTLHTVPLRPFTGAGIYYPESSTTALFSAMYKYSAELVDSDPKSQVLFASGINHTLKVQSIVMLGYTDTVDLNNPPPAIKPFVDGSIPYSNSHAAVQNGTLGDMADVLGGLQTPGRRTTRQTFSVELDLDLLEKLRQLWIDMAADYANVEGFEGEFAFHPIPKSWVAASDARGGNSLGIKSPVVLLWAQSFWASSKDDKRMEEFEDKLFQSFENTAKAVGKLAEFRYLNYGDRRQDIIGHYGAESVERLVQVKRKYDPHNVFGTLVPGGFKIPGF